MSRHDIDTGGIITHARIIDSDGRCAQEITSDINEPLLLDRHNLGRWRPLGMLPLRLRPRDAGRRIKLADGAIAEITFSEICADPIPDDVLLDDVAADGDDACTPDSGDVDTIRQALLAETNARLTAEPTLTPADVRRVLDGLTREIDSGKLGRALADRIAAAAAASA